MDIKSYRNQIALYMISGCMFCIIVGGITALIVINFTELSRTANVAISCTMALFAAIAFSNFIKKRASEPLEAIMQTIRHISNDHNAAAPDIDNIKFARGVVQTVSKEIYSLASSKANVNMQFEYEHDYMQTLLKESPLPIIVVDHDKKIRYFNDAAAKFLNKTVENPVNTDLNTSYDISYPNEKTFDNWLEHCQANKIRDVQIWERVKMQVDERVHIFDMVAAFNKNESHGIEVTIMLFDHTDRYRADDAQVSFVSLAVHELRTPITVLRGYIEVFEDELGPELDEEQQEFMQRMALSATQLSTFINNILNVVRIDNDQLKIQMVEDDWLSIINTAATEFTNRAKARGRSVKVELPESVPSVAVDRVSIYEVLSNLVDNAIKYSYEDGEIVIKVQEKDGLIETTVTDSGIGIPSGVISHLFDKFYRSHRSRDNVGGTGLGLYLSKAIVDAHGGQIWVRSTEGKGSVFGFTLQPYSAVENAVSKSDNSDTGIVRTAHGWIKNHNLIRK